MVTKYLYLDDESPESIKPYSQAVMGTGKEIKIDVEHPANFLGDFLSLFNRLKEYQGIILDWRLDETSDQNKKRFDSRASSVAQEIRTRTTQKKLSPIPVILWSQKSKLTATYKDDFTSHDLFDLTYKKEYVSENPEIVRKQLIAMAIGYQKIINFKKDSRTFKINELLVANEDQLDIRIHEKFKSKSPSTHEVAQFIYRDLIIKPGLLIDELRLAARLGIAIDNSSGWSKILAFFDKYKYKGPFSDAWPRWWAFGVEKEWWTSVNEKNQPLSLLTSEDRVSIIKKKTKIQNLVAAIPIANNYHSRFYTICEYYKKPLDIIDGVIIEEPEPEPWQERRYLSLEAALERLGDIKPHSTELERLRQIRRKGK